MQNIINDYKDYRDVDKKLFQEFLEDIFLAEKTLKKNKGKKNINQAESDDSIKKAISRTGEYFQEEGITKEELATINEDLLNKEVYGLENKEEEGLVGISFYKGVNETTQNDNLFMKRISIGDVLIKNGFIKTSPFNIIKEFNNSDKSDIPFVKEMLSDKHNELKEKYGEPIIKRQLEGLKGKEKYFQFIVYNKKNLRELYNALLQSDIKDLEYINGALKYGGRVIYMPKRLSDRALFLELMFSKIKKEYFKITDIYNYIEGLDKRYLSESESKKIYNLKDKINKKIEKEVGIKKTFSLGQGGQSGEMYRIY